MKMLFICMTGALFSLSACSSGQLNQVQRCTETADCAAGQGCWQQVCTPFCGTFDDCPVAAEPGGSTAQQACDPILRVCRAPLHVDTDHDSVWDEIDRCLGADDNDPAVDRDGDGIPDLCDPCPNGKQTDDADGDTTPDACERCPGFDDRLDDDKDGFPNGCDVCADAPDGDDSDHDNVPNACDKCPGVVDGPDTDGDGVPDGCDRCKTQHDRFDTDGDGVANDCDTCAGANDLDDDDGDGVPKACDRCPNDFDGVTADGLVLHDDMDGDGACNSVDPCFGIDNTNDRDQDGICDSIDNCPDTANRGETVARLLTGVQSDADGDGLGDACDNDADNDGRNNDDDNCWLVANGACEPVGNSGSDTATPAGAFIGCDANRDGIISASEQADAPVSSGAGVQQPDADGDGLGDACESDDDDDGVADGDDNCPKTANAGQEDWDEDGQGDACDADKDGDGVVDTLVNGEVGPDNCPLAANGLCSLGALTCDSNGDGTTTEREREDGAQVDTDEDGRGNACDHDDDGDGVADSSDNCRLAPNGPQMPLEQGGQQADLDRDGLGDVCDPDRDGDGVIDTVDNCPGVANGYCNVLDDGTAGTDPSGVIQLDVVCDGNRDGAISPNERADGRQQDSDGDGVGDACTGDDDGDGIVDAADNCQDVANGWCDDPQLGAAACDVNRDGRVTALERATGITAHNGAGELLPQPDANQNGVGDACDPNPGNAVFAAPWGESTATGLNAQDPTSLVAAVRQAVSQGGLQTVKLLAGEYMLTSPLEVPAQVSVVGGFGWDNIKRTFVPPGSYRNQAGELVRDRLSHIETTDTTVLVLTAASAAGALDEGHRQTLQGLWLQSADSPAADADNDGSTQTVLVTSMSGGLHLVDSRLQPGDGAAGAAGLVVGATVEGQFVPTAVAGTTPTAGAGSHGYSATGGACPGSGSANVPQAPEGGSNSCQVLAQTLTSRGGDGAASSCSAEYAHFRGTVGRAGAHGHPGRGGDERRHMSEVAAAPAVAPDAIAGLWRAARGVDGLPGEVGHGGQGGGAGQGYRLGPDNDYLFSATGGAGGGGGCPGLGGSGGTGGGGSFGLLVLPAARGAVVLEGVNFAMGRGGDGGSGQRGGVGEPGQLGGAGGKLGTGTYSLDDSEGGRGGNGGRGGHGGCGQGGGGGFSVGVYYPTREDTQLLTVAIKDTIRSVPTGGANVASDDPADAFANRAGQGGPGVVGRAPGSDAVICTGLAGPVGYAQAALAYPTE